MRKTLLLPLVVFMAIAIAAPPASAVSIVPGPKVGQFYDYSALWDLDQSDQDPDTAGVQPPATQGTAVDHDGPRGVHMWAEQRSVLRVSSIIDEASLNPDFGISDPDELTGLMYELELAQIHLWAGSIVLDFAPVGMGAGSPNLPRNPLGADVDGDSAALVGMGWAVGGVIEIYEDLTKDFDVDPLNNPNQDYETTIGAGIVPPVGGIGTAPAPTIPAGAGVTQWVEGQSTAQRDSFATVTDDTLWLSMALVDLNYVLSTGEIALTVGEPGFVANTVLREYLTFDGAKGRGMAYANVFGGSAQAMVDRGYIQPFVDVAMEFEVTTVSFSDQNGSWASGLTYDGDELITDNGSYRGVGHFTVDSTDPFRFGVIPEPTTVSLLGLSLLGLFGTALRKRRAG